MLYNTNKTVRMYTKYILRLLWHETKRVLKALLPLSPGMFCSPTATQSSTNVILELTGTFEAKSLTWFWLAQCASTVISHWHMLESKQLYFSTGLVVSVLHEMQSSVLENTFKSLASKNSNGNEVRGKRCYVGELKIPLYKRSFERLKLCNCWKKVDFLVYTHCWHVWRSTGCYH